MKIFETKTVAPVEDVEFEEVEKLEEEAAEEMAGEPKPKVKFIDRVKKHGGTVAKVAIGIAVGFGAAVAAGLAMSKNDDELEESACYFEEVECLEDGEEETEE